MLWSSYTFDWGYRVHYPALVRGYKAPLASGRISWVIQLMNAAMIALIIQNYSKMNCRHIICHNTYKCTSSRLQKPAYNVNRNTVRMHLTHFRCSHFRCLCRSTLLSTTWLCLSITLTRIQKLYCVSGKQQFAGAAGDGAGFQSHHITHYSRWFAKAPQQPPATPCSCHLWITNCSFWREPLHRSQEPRGFRPKPAPDLKVMRNGVQGGAEFAFEPNTERASMVWKKEREGGCIRDRGSIRRKKNTKAWPASPSFLFKRSGFL